MIRLLALAAAVSLAACGAPPAGTSGGHPDAGNGDAGGGSDAGAPDGGGKPDGGGFVCPPLCPPNTTCSAATGNICRWQGDPSKPIRFAFFGDTRPSDPWPANQTTAPYPSAVINKVFDLIEARKPDFAVFGGDTLFVDPADYNLAKSVLQTYLLPARAHYTGDVHWVLGNHESYGGNQTAWNEIISKYNYSWFVRPLADGSEAKFVLTATNEWDGYQSDWVKKALSYPTRYTFLFRHHPSSCQSCDLYQAMYDVIASYPRTLFLAGHSHEYRKTTSNREVVCGNGGAPLAGGSAYYGYCMIEQQADGKVKVTSYRSDADTVEDSWSVTP